MARGGARKGAGRKRGLDEQRIRDLTSPYVPGAIEQVVHVMKNGKNDSDKLNAAKLLLAYHFGQPSHQIDHTTNGKAIHEFPIIQVCTPTNLKE